MSTGAESLGLTQGWTLLEKAFYLLPGSDTPGHIPNLLFCLLQNKESRLKKKKKKPNQTISNPPKQNGSRYESGLRACSQIFRNAMADLALKLKLSFNRWSISFLKRSQEMIAKRFLFFSHVEEGRVNSFYKTIGTGTFWRAGSWMQKLPQQLHVEGGPVLLQCKSGAWVRGIVLSAEQNGSSPIYAFGFLNLRQKLHLAYL